MSYITTEVDIDVDLVLEACDDETLLAEVRERGLGEHLQGDRVDELRRLILAGRTQEALALLDRMTRPKVDLTQRYMSLPRGADGRPILTFEDHAAPT